MRRNKFGAKPITIDGHRFPSLKEGRRYSELKILLQAGKISDMVLQPKYPLLVNGRVCGNYFADFRYFDLVRCREVVEDVKGGKATQTQVSKLKIKLVHAIHGIEVVIV